MSEWSILKSRRQLDNKIYSLIVYIKQKHNYKTIQTTCKKNNNFAAWFQHEANTTYIT